MATEVIIDDREVKKMLARIIDKNRQVTEQDKAYVGLLSAIVFQDLIDHFEKESGPDGRWPEWSEKYAAFLARVGKSGNNLLQDTGRLKGGWAPANVRTVSDGIVWFNPVNYAERHNEGIGVKKREFAWLSDFAVEKINRQTVQFILDE